MFVPGFSSKGFGVACEALFVYDCGKTGQRKYFINNVAATKKILFVVVAGIAGVTAPIEILFK
jgi:hypothetical protein